jgi:anaerobic selenocysteine-containing dehydrogenase
MVNTVCQLCPGGCGIRVRLIEGKRAVRIDGNPKHPVNQGGICPLGAAGAQLQYGLSRIETPLRQTGKRGDVKTLEPTSWDEALKLLAAQMQSVRKQPQGLVYLGDRSQGTVGELFARFLQAYGSPNYLAMPAAAEAESLGLLLSQGEPGALAYDLENAKVVISFGAGIIDGWGSPARMLMAFNGWRSQSYMGRTRIIQVETRGSLSASKADDWVAVAPGTEAALALGLAHVIVSDQLYDRSFVNGHSFGFEDWNDAQGRRHLGFKSMVLKDYAPERVGEITGVPKEKIISLAHEFARTKPAVALSGRGQGRMPGSIYEFLAVQSLNALVGSLHQPGGMSRAPKIPLAPWPQVVLDETAIRGGKSPRLGVVGGAQALLSPGQVYTYLKSVNKGAPYSTRVLWVHDANPAHDLADSQLFLDALDKIETVVSFSSYMNETTMLADLVLPGPTYLERLEDGPTPAGIQYAVFNLSRPVLKPRFETKHPGDLLIQLAKSLGGSVAASFPWNDYEAALKERVKGLLAAKSGRVASEPGAKPWAGQGRRLEPNYGSFDELWAKLTEHGCWFDTSQAMPSWNSAFKTPSGAFEFFCQRLRDMGVVGEDLTFLPHYEAGVPPGDPGEYLLMPYETLAITNGPLANPPFMTKLLFDFELKGNDSFVEINPQTAARVGVGESDRISLKSERGTLKCRAHLTEAARPGVVFIPMGLGHRAFDSYISGKGVNANEILVARQDLVTGLASWWGTRIRISKA